jgi:hypothetical protein
MEGQSRGARGGGTGTMENMGLGPATQGTWSILNAAASRHPPVPWLSSICLVILSTTPFEIWLSLIVG